MEKKTIYIVTGALAGVGLLAFLVVKSATKKPATVASPKISTTPGSKTKVVPPTVAPTPAAAVDQGTTVQSNWGDDGSYEIRFKDGQVDYYLPNGKFSYSVGNSDGETNIVLVQCTYDNWDSAGGYKMTYQDGSTSYFKADDSFVKNE